MARSAYPVRETNMSITARLDELGLTLPPPPAPVASYLPSLAVPPNTALICISGQIPIENGHPVATGQVPGEVPLDRARALAERCTLQALSALQAQIGDLDRLIQTVRLEGFVACHPGFGEHPAVINGASELLETILGERGRHARMAVGVPSLPLNVPVEIAFIFAVKM
ncbi:MAG: RidA family protein [Planctomycetota bacterium]